MVRKVRLRKSFTLNVPYHATSRLSFYQSDLLDSVYVTKRGWASPPSSIKQLNSTIKMEQKELLAEHALDGIAKVLDLYKQQKNGENIGDERFEQFKEWFDRLVNY